MSETTQTYTIGEHDYTAEEVGDAIAYMEKDIAYLEAQIPKYTNDYILSTLSLNIAYGKNLLHVFRTVAAQIEAAK